MLCTKHFTRTVLEKKILFYPGHAHCLFTKSSYCCCIRERRLAKLIYATKGSSGTLVPRVLRVTDIQYAVSICLTTSTAVLSLQYDTQVPNAYDVTIGKYRKSHTKLMSQKSIFCDVWVPNFVWKFQICPLIFQRFPLKFHTKFGTHAPYYLHFVGCWNFNELWYLSVMLSWVLVRQAPYLPEIDTYTTETTCLQQRGPR